MIAAHFTDLVPFLYNVKTLKGIQSVKLASPAVHKGYLEELWLTLVNLDNVCKTAICNRLFVFDYEVYCYHFFHFSPHEYIRAEQAAHCNLFLMVVCASVHGSSLCCITIHCAQHYFARLELCVELFRLLPIELIVTCWQYRRELSIYNTYMCSNFCILVLVKL